MSGYPRVIEAGAAKPGMMLDLEGDPYADPDRDEIAFEFEYQTVIEVEPVGQDIVRIAFDLVAADFPAQHPLVCVGIAPNWQDA